MASRSSSRGLVNTLKRRMYAAQAAARPELSECLPKQDPKLTKLPNGVIVASIENYSLAARVGVIVNAGSRFEDGSNIGIVHCLRTAAGLSTQNTSSFGLTRNIQQNGSNFVCTASREYILYSSECLRDSVPLTVNLMRQVCTEPAFKPWELADLGNSMVEDSHLKPAIRMKHDLAVLHQQPQVHVLDLLHQAAFRNTLGRSLFAENHMIGKYNTNMLLDFVRKNYIEGHIGVVGVGVDHDQLCAEASKFVPFTNTRGATEKAVCHGGEIRVNTSSPIVHVAVATEAPGMPDALSSPKEAVACRVLQMIMGAGQYIRYGTGAATSRLGQAAAAATNDPFSVSCVNVSYSDGGLFGFQAAADSANIGKVLKSVFSQFASITKEGGITEADVTRGKKQLKASLYMSEESCQNILSDLGEQAMVEGELTSLENRQSQIDAVTINDVVNIARKIINRKASMACVGNLASTPYLDELYK